MAATVACLAGVREGRGRELGRETTRTPKFPLPLPLLTPATQATATVEKIWLRKWICTVWNVIAVTESRSICKCSTRSCPPFSHRIVERAKRVRVWKSPYARQAWGDFHACSLFAHSTIPVRKWGTTRSLANVGELLWSSVLKDCLVTEL